MNRHILSLCLLLCAAAATSQSPGPVPVTGGTLLSVFGFRNPSVFEPGDDVVFSIPRTTRREIGSIEGDLTGIDTVEEFYTGYYLSPIRIENVERVLSKDDRRFALELYTMWKMKAAGVQFSNMDPAIKTRTLANYDMIQRSILARGGISVADADAYYRTAVAAEVDRVVNEEFAKVLFRTTDTMYNVTLLRKDTGYDVTYVNGLGVTNTV